jgi:hypothetical protein
MTVCQSIQEQARLLADENRRAEPTISKVYWFPHDAEVRLVELDDAAPRNDDGAVHPFYFHAAPQENLPAPSGVAIIRPDEFGRLTLPSEWGDWDDAREI